MKTTTTHADRIRAWRDARPVPQVRPEAECFDLTIDRPPLNVTDILALLDERDQLVSDRDRFRTAWQLARTRARSAGAGADMYAKRSRDLHEALMDTIGGEFVDLIEALTAPICEADDFGNCVTHGVLALEAGAQCPHAIARALLELIRPSTQVDGGTR